MKFKILFVILFSLLLVNSSFSQIPNTMNYQGLLTDASGVALSDGNYNLTFRIYDVATGGSALWTEAQLVLVESGIFNAMLGNSTALNLDFDVPYWMGIQVAADPELAPRVELTSSAYTFNSMNAEAIGGNAVISVAPSSGQVLKWSGSAWAPGSDNAGTSVWTTSGDDIYNSNIGNVGVGIAAPIANMHVAGDDGGSLMIGGNASSDSAKLTFSEDYVNTFGMTLQYDGFNNALEVFGKAGATTYGPHMYIARSSGATIFSGSSVTLPADAISAPEIDDEPGVASATQPFTITLAGGIEVLLSRSISVPTAGYVLVIASSRIGLTHTTGTISYGEFGVSDNSTTFPGTQELDVQIPSTAPSGLYYIPLAANGLFPVTAGTHSFYFLGDENSGSLNAADIQLSLLFVPTAYGTVTPTKFEEGLNTNDESIISAPLTPADIAAEQSEAQSFNQQRIERELASLRAEIEAIKAASRNEVDN